MDSATLRRERTPAIEALRRSASLPLPKVLPVAAVLLPALLVLACAHTEAPLRFAAPAVEPAGPALPLLAPGAPLARQTAAGERFEVALTAQAGHYLRVGVDVRGIEASVRLVGPDGAALATAGPRGGADRRALSLVTPADGGYRIDVADTAGVGRGLVRLKIEELRDAAPGDLERVSEERVLADRLAAALAGPPGAVVGPLEDMLAHVRRVGDRRGEAVASNALEDHLFYAGSANRNLETAISGLERALDTANAAGCALTEADALIDLAWAKERQDQPQEALELYRRALAALEGAGDLRLQGQTFQRLGVVALRRLGLVDTAGLAFERALELARATGDLRGEAAALSGLGETAIQHGEPDEALRWYERARALYQRLDDPIGLASADRAMAELYQGRGEPRTALELYHRALTTGGIDERTRGLTLHDLALLHLSLGDFDEALARARQALDLFAGRRSKDEVAALSTISELLQVRGDLPAALRAV